MAEKDKKLDQVCEMEAELEDERRMRAQAVSAKERLEIELSEREAQLILNKEAQVKTRGQLKKAQTQLEDQLWEMEELRVVKEVALSGAKEKERTVKSLAAEKEPLRRELSAADRSLKQVLQDRDALHEEVTSCHSMITALKEVKLKCEADMSQLEEELKEYSEPVYSELVNDRMKEANVLADMLSTELASERRKAQKSETARQQLERLNKKLTAKMQELKSSVKSKSQVRDVQVQTQSQVCDVQVQTQAQFHVQF